MSRRDSRADKQWEGRVVGFFGFVFLLVPEGDGTEEIWVEGRLPGEGKEGAVSRNLQPWKGTKYKGGGSLETHKSE